MTAVPHKAVEFVCAYMAALHHKHPLREGLTLVFDQAHLLLLCMRVSYQSSLKSLHIRVVLLHHCTQLPHAELVGVFAVAGNLLLISSLGRNTYNWANDAPLQVPSSKHILAGAPGPVC